VTTVPAARASAAVAFAALTACVAPVEDEILEPTPTPAPDEPVLVEDAYVVTDRTLYRLLAEPLRLEEVGTLDGCSSVIDVALSGDGRLFVTQSFAISEVDPDTADCELLASGVYPDSLAFLPFGTYAPDEEALVGVRGSMLVRYDIDTGSGSWVGSVGDYDSSGDLATVPGVGTFLTVTGDVTDFLLEIDPLTGEAVHEWGALGRPHVFGLGFFAQTLFGFTAVGEVFEIELGDGDLATTPADIGGLPAGAEFHGAASSPREQILP